MSRSRTIRKRWEEASFKRSSKQKSTLHPGLIGGHLLYGLPRGGRKALTIIVFAAVGASIVVRDEAGGVLLCCGRAIRLLISNFYKFKIACALQTAKLQNG